MNLTNLVIIFILIITNTFSQSFRLKRPVKDNIQTNGSYLYGEPSIANPNNAHRGIDIAIVNDTVFSASNGTVFFVGYNPNDPIGGYEPDGCGNYIFIQSMWNDKNLYLLYCHLTKPLVSQGSNVTEGEQIAISGNTGYSTGPHLHFELRMNSPNYSVQRSRRNGELWIGISGMGAIYGKVPNAPNSTRVDIFPDPKPRPPYTTFSYALTYNFNDPYIGSDDIYGENYSIGDVKPGTYTITALGGSYIRTVTVGEGEVVNADSPTSAEDNSFANLNFELMQNYPNPFNPSTNISFSLLENSIVRLEVFNLLGERISILINEVLQSGVHSIEFTANDLAAGTLLYVLNVKSENEAQWKSLTKKMIYLK